MCPDRADCPVVGTSTWDQRPRTGLVVTALTLFDQTPLDSPLWLVPLSDNRVRLVAAERDAAIAQVEAHSPPEWRVEAFAFLTEYLRTHREMFVDDLWTAGLPVPPELRALGALFNRAVRAGLMRKTDRYLPSVRSHLSPKVVWRSLSFEGN